MGTVSAFRLRVRGLSGRVHCRSVAFALLVAAILVGTRALTAPLYLFYFDSVNFALALQEFDPSKHQPQPPGYPLFVLFTRALHLVVDRPEHVFILAGLILAFAAVLVLKRLVAAMHSERAGYLAAALLVCNPVLWLGGLTSQVRVSLAFCSVAVAFLAWRALERPAEEKRLWIVFMALGLVAGFRPALGVLMLPLLVAVWWRTGQKVRSLLVGFACLLLSALPWVAATVWSVGGPP